VIQTLWRYGRRYNKGLLWAFPKRKRQVMKRRAMYEFQVSLIRGLVLIIFIQVTEWLRSRSFYLTIFFWLVKSLYCSLEAWNAYTDSFEPVTKQTRQLIPSETSWRGCDQTSFWYLRGSCTLSNTLLIS